MQVRNFAGADLPALVNLTTSVRTSQGDERAVTPETLMEDLGRPGLDPEQNCYLLEDVHGPSAYFILTKELRIGRIIIDFGVHPDHQGTGLEEELIRSALKEARPSGAKVLHVCVAPSQFWSDLLQEQGFSHVRSYRQMKWDGTEVPTIDLPTEYTIESFKPGDAERLTRAQNDAFTGSWGFCPNTVEEVSYWVGTSTSKPEGILFLAEGGNTGGHCWTLQLKGKTKTTGVIGMIGVTPPYRRRGLSRPLLLAGMKYLHSRPVDYITLYVDEGNYSAVGLYESVGFTKIAEFHWFEAPLSNS